MSPPDKSRVWSVVVVAVLVGFVLVAGGFLALWQFLAPSERKVMVPYSEFIEEVHAGRVREIRVHGRDIDYQLADPDKPMVIMRHTVGPVPDQAFIDRQDRRGRRPVAPDRMGLEGPRSGDNNRTDSWYLEH